MVKGYFYVLESFKKADLYYTGSCVNIESRVADHNRGNTTFTKKFIPWKLIYVEEYATLKEARQRERQIKKWKNKERIKALIKRK